MIEITFQFGDEIKIVRLRGNNVTFLSKSGYQIKEASLEQLKLSVSGILKEFPELKGKEDIEIKKEGVILFKKHIVSLRTENEKVNYIINDLSKHGYIPKYVQREGHRAVKVR